MSKDVLAPLVTSAMTLTVTDKDSLATASNLRSGAKQYLKDLTEEKEKVTKLLNEALKAERARFKPLEDKVESIIAHLDKQMSAYQSKEMARIKAEEDAVVAKVETGYIKPETAVAKLSAIKTVDKTVGGTRFVTDYEVVVVNIREVPTEYVKIEVRTLVAKAALKVGVKIPGLALKEIQRPVSTGT